MTARRELSYDGKGINGPDEYRTRIATFTSAENAEKYGVLFQSAPEMFALLSEVSRIGCTPTLLRHIDAFVVRHTEGE